MVSKAKHKRVALYLRVSTDRQTVENQRAALCEAAEQRGWHVTAVYEDQGISGSKGRDERPGLDKALRDATRGQYDVLMSWSVDRLGRSLMDLVATLQELHSSRIDLFLHQQGVDTTTPAGKAMFQMLGVFAEFERSMIQSRVHAGLTRAKEAGVQLGRPKLGTDIEAAVRERLATGMGQIRVAKEVGCSAGYVNKIARQIRAEA